MLMPIESWGFQLQSGASLATPSPSGLFATVQVRFDDFWSIINVSFQFPGGCSECIHIQQHQALPTGSCIMMPDEVLDLKLQMILH